MPREKNLILLRKTEDSGDENGALFRSRNKKCSAAWDVEQKQATNSKLSAFGATPTEIPSISVH
jgi:hypothetical protein